MTTLFEFLLYLFVMAMDSLKNCSPSESIPIAVSSFKMSARQ